MSRSGLAVRNYAKHPSKATMAPQFTVYIQTKLGNPHCKKKRNPHCKPKSAQATPSTSSQATLPCALAATGRFQSAQATPLKHALRAVSRRARKLAYTHIHYRRQLYSIYTYTLVRCKLACSSGNPHCKPNSAQATPLKHALLALPRATPLQDALREHALLASPLALLALPLALLALLLALPADFACFSVLRSLSFSLSTPIYI